MKLNDYKKYFNLNYDQFIEQNHIDSGQIHENVRYQKLLEVSRIDLNKNEFFFFKEGELKMIYISEDALANKLWIEFQSIVNTDTPEKTVRSRAGKTSNQLIFASQGITVSLNNDDVDFIEIYSPCSLPAYLANIYSEPSPFIR